MHLIIGSMFNKQVPKLVGLNAVCDVCLDVTHAGYLIKSKSLNIYTFICR